MKHKCDSFKIIVVTFVKILDLIISAYQKFTRNVIKEVDIWSIQSSQNLHEARHIILHVDFSFLINSDMLSYTRH